jgi:hypothetical protein
MEMRRGFARIRDDISAQAFGISVLPAGSPFTRTVGTLRVGYVSSAWQGNHGLRPSAGFPAIGSVKLPTDPFEWGSGMRNPEVLWFARIKRESTSRRVNYPGRVFGF